MSSVKRILKRLLLESLIGYSSREWQQVKCSFSQFGEDIVIDHLLGLVDSGSKHYVDVGAYDPIYLSNTYYFYRCGWRGLVIDANPNVLTRYENVRPEDEVINAFVSNQEGIVDFTVFDADMFSTLSSNVKNVPKEFQSGQREFRVRATSLQALIEQSGIKTFAILNIDVEGNDLNVLRSFDLKSFRPKVVCCEDHSISWQHSDTANYMFNHGYEIAARVGLSSIYTLLQ